jgi:hypothetical protein
MSCFNISCPKKQLSESEHCLKPKTTLIVSYELKKLVDIRTAITNLDLEEETKYTCAPLKKNVAHHYFTRGI